MTDWPGLGPTRLAPGHPLPPARYIPGVEGRHPRRGGIEHEPGLPPIRAWDLTDPFDNPHYIHGLDLLRTDFWWESHELLEELWHLAGRETLEHRILQGLIIAAAVRLKEARGDRRTADSLAAKLTSRVADIDRDVKARFLGRDPRFYLR